MDSFAIGISGLEAALKGLSVVGNNIANAATEGFHRQRIELTPAYSTQLGDIILGGGVDVSAVSRIVDNLLEEEITQQNCTFGQISQELGTLRTVESAFGELSGANDADTMASQFRTLAGYLTRVEERVVLEAQETVEEINTLVSQVAELNSKIQSLELTGNQASNMRDQRDQLITDLSELVGVQTQTREYGVVDVTAAGLPVVTGGMTTELEVSLQAGGILGVSVAGEDNYSTELQGGKLGGLFTLKNELLSDIHTDLDSLAAAVIQQINQYHVQGVGSTGSFSSLASRSMTSEDVSDFIPSVSDGTIYFRLTNQTTGEVTRESITVTAATDTLSSIAIDITNNITGLTASVDSSNRLSIQASGYKFDFMPAVLSSPTGLTGTSSPTMSGIYTGTDNDTFQFTVVDTGTVGNGSLQLQVKDNGGAGSVIATLDIGSGYAAGDRLLVADGIYVSISAGTVNDGENFDVEVFDDTDTSGLLSAIGLNTFFSGTSASNIGICSDISTTPGRIATASGADMTDNTNVVRMVQLRDVSVSSLNDLTIGQFYQGLVTDIGQKIASREIRKDNVETVTRNLFNRRDEISGVDMNQEAAEMLVFERMFQGMARYLNTAQGYYESLMSLL